MLNSNHPIGKPLFCILSLLTTVLHALSQPVIDSQPKDLTALAGTDAVFSVAATGTLPLSYQWRRFIGPTTSLVLTGATEATLTLPTVSYSQNTHRFSVVVSNSTGSVTSRIARLTVLSPPFFPTPPTNIAVLPGKTASFAPTIGGTAPFRYQWMFQSPDQPLPNATNRTLSIKNVQPTNTGSYYLVATNAYGAVTSPPAQLSIFWAPMTGTDIPALAHLDTNMQSLLLRYSIPGGALGVAKEGRLVFVRGYGYADTNHGERVEPDSLFRVASLSKVVTATMTMKLVEEGKLRLGDQVFGILNYPAPTYRGSISEPRLTQITVRQLLTHTSGWSWFGGQNPNGGTSFNPWTWGERAAADMETQAPASAETVIRWMMGKPLVFNPGEAYAYNNTGFIALGRVIEKITGKTYEAHALDRLRPLGITRMRIGGSTAAERYPGEVSYYDYPPAVELPIATTLYGCEPRSEDTTLAYAYNLKALEAGGGWIASAVDYLRFINGVDGRPNPPDFLSPATSALMSSSTAQSIAAGEPYGMARALDLGPSDWRHSGLYFGTRAMIVRLGNGISYFYVFNFAPILDDASYQETLDTIQTGINTTKGWPTNDFFATTLSYDAWRSQHFIAAELADPAISGEGENPDGDGVVNLLEYASGSNPKVADADHAPTGSVVTVEGQTYFALTFRRLILGYELDYTVEASDDLLTWSPLTDPVGSPQLNSDGTQTVTTRDRLPIARQSQRFLRLRVARQLP